MLRQILYSVRAMHGRGKTTRVRAQPVQLLLLSSVLQRARL